MLHNPRVSVVMPAFNMEQYIGESIDSVLSQTFADWELLIVDDGSTDKTAKAVEPYLTDKRVRYFYQQNFGPGYARNKAIANAQAEYIAFLDADDLWLPQKLEESVKLITVYDCDLIFTNCYLFEDGEPISSKLPQLNVITATYSRIHGLIDFLEQNRIPNLTVLAKKSSLINAGLFNNFRAAEDYDLWLRMLHQGARFHSYSKSLAAYRVRTDSITARDRLALFESMLVLKSFAHHHPEYRAVIFETLRRKFKYWLYNGHQPEAEKFRKLVTGIYSSLGNLFLYPLSYLLPFKYLRKITNRLT